MIFARRAIQRRLDAIRDLLDEKDIGQLVRRLNNPGRDRMAAMWEVVVFSALAKLGKLEHEKPLSSGSKPDILFENAAIRFTADVTCVSDDGLDERNPFEELFRLVQAVKSKLRLPPGGLDIRVSANRNTQMTLRLPPRKDLHDFVQNEIRPQIREQMDAGASPIRVLIDDDRAGIEITIDPAGSEFSSGGYAPYDAPTELTSNPLYNALKAKASGQLRHAAGVKGIIVADGDNAALGNDRVGLGAYSPRQIAMELLRQYSSIDFVLLLAVREGMTITSPSYSMTYVNPILVMREGDARRADFASLFARMVEGFPKPVNSAVNGARRAAERGYDLGNHGGYKTVGDKKIRVSSRELLEVLAGLRVFDDGVALNLAPGGESNGPKSEVTRGFLRALSKGRMPSSISVIRGSDDENDDWIEFEFGDRDPAISPFR
ncbi:hypothetical protein HFO95_20440 [Rhizobium leguminosarum]|nr:hypothetical protein [Rhizobium leguminosarum]